MKNTNIGIVNTQQTTTLKINIVWRIILKTGANNIVLPTNVYHSTHLSLNDLTISPIRMKLTVDQDF